MNERKKYMLLCAYAVGGNETKEKKKLIKSECKLKQWQKNI
jgi:hypothetical protein